MEEGAVLCQRDQDFQKMMKAKKKNFLINNNNNVFLICTCFQVISKNSFIAVIQLISIVNQLTSF